jgi:hypothetical protein
VAALLYGTTTSPFAPEAGEALVDAAAKRLKTLGPAPQGR